MLSEGKEKFGLETNALTLSRYVLQEQRKTPGATGDFSTLLNSLLTAIKCISAAVRKAGLQQLYVLSGVPQL